MSLPCKCNWLGYGDKITYFINILLLLSLQGNTLFFIFLCHSFWSWNTGRLAAEQPQQPQLSETVVTASSLYSCSMKHLKKLLLRILKCVTQNRAIALLGDGRKNKPFLPKEKHTFTSRLGLEHFEKHIVAPDTITVLGVAARGWSSWT